MKRILLLFTIIFLLAGCGRDGGKDPAPAPVPTQTPTPTPSPGPTPSPSPTPTPVTEVRIGSTVIPLDAEEADISGEDLSGIDMGEVLSQLPALTRLTMIGCGMSNEEYATLQDAYPEIRMIWEIVLSHWTLRTDTVAFSTFKTTGDDFFMHNDEAYYLKYCTDMVALDLGHNFVSDLSFLQYMPNLQILILVDNVKEWDPPGPRHTITDLSMLRFVPKLKYLEFFANNIQDFSFLQYLPDLEDVNMSYTGLRSIEYLRDKPHLERLWIEHTHITYDQYTELTQLYPAAKIVLYGEGSIDQGWRSGAHYSIMRSMFRENYVDEHYR